MAKLGTFFKTLGTKIATLWKTTKWFKIASIGGAVVIVTSAVVIPNAIISETGGIFHKCDFSVESIDTQYSYSEANCTEKAKYYYSCACGGKGTELFEYGNALGHDLTHYASKQVTCTEIGYDEYDTCSRCDYTTYNEISATGHTDGEWITDANATCTEDGSKHQICSVCEETINTAVIPATGHTDGEWITDANATCTEDGSKHQICSVCEETIKTEDIAANGHDFGDWYIVQEATCAVSGIKERVCECTVKETVTYSVEHPSEFISATKSNDDYIATWHCPTCGVNFDKEFDPITATCGVYNWYISTYATIIWQINASGGIGDYSYTIHMYEQSYAGSTNYTLKETWNNETNPIFAYNKSNTNQLYSIGYMFRITVSDSVGSVTYEYWFDNYLNSYPSQTYIYTAYTLR